MPIDVMDKANVLLTMMYFMLSKYFANTTKVGLFFSFYFFLVWRKAFNFKPESRLVIKSMDLIYDNSIKADSLYSHGEHRKH